MLLASAVIAVSGFSIGSAGAAPIRADLSVDHSDALLQQVQMRGHGGGGGGGGGGSAMRSGGGPGGGGFSMSRGGGAPMAGGAAINRGASSNFTGNRVVQGGNFTGNRVVQGGNFTSNRVIQGGNWNGRRDFSDRRFRRGFRGPSFAFGFGPSYYDYGYYPYDDYGYYDDYAYGDDYVAVAPGVAGGNDVTYCQQRYRSYDPSTGTYLGYDGLRHSCP
jgi:hypothetical protein